VHRLAAISLRYPGRVAAGLAVVTLILGAALPGLRPEFGYRVLLGGDHPAIQRLEGVMDAYGGGFPGYIVWRCGDGAPCDSVFDDSSMQAAARLEQALRTVEGVRAVRSPASLTLLMPAEDGFAARRWSDLLPGDATGREAFAARAVEDPLWEGKLVSSDGRTGAVIVLLEDSRNQTAERVTDAVFAAMAPLEAKGFEFHLAGEAIESVVAGRDLAASTAALTPLIAVIVASIVLALTRSWQATAITMTAVGLSVLWTFGFLAWMGWPQDSILEVLAPLIMTLGTCDAVHLLSQAGNRLARSPDLGRSEALLAAAGDVGPACVMTTLTTAVALASFATSELGTFVRFGTTAAFGTLACLFLTFTFIPVLTTRLDLPPLAPEARGWSGALAALIGAVERGPGRVIAAAALLVALGGVGIVWGLHVGTDISAMYGEQNRVTRWTRFVERHLRGLESLELDLRLPGELAILQPESHAAIDRLTGALEAEPALGPASSVLDVLRQLNRVLHDDDPAFHRSAPTVRGNAELFELIGFDSPQLLDAWITPARDRVRISVQADSDARSDDDRFVDSLRARLADLVPADWDMTLTGSFVLDFEWVEEVQRTQLRSFATAFVIVLAMLSLFLRSLPLGLLAMVPALIPVVLVLGFLGWTGLPLDVGRLMIAAIVIGIGVDDSIHLLNGYRTLRHQGRTRSEAMRESLTAVGRALVITSLSLGLGFVALVLSAWQTISSFGFFVCMAILVALLAAVLVVPAVIHLGVRWLGEGRDRSAATGAR